MPKQAIIEVSIFSSFSMGNEEYKPPHKLLFYANYSQLLSLLGVKVIISVIQKFSVIYVDVGCFILKVHWILMLTIGKSRGMQRTLRSSAKNSSFSCSFWKNIAK